MNASTIRFSTFPRTEPPPSLVEGLVNVFRQHEQEIATETKDKGLKSRKEAITRVERIHRSKR